MNRNRNRRRSEQVAVLQSKPGEQAGKCINEKGGFWMMCLGGFRGCCAKNDCSWCKANGSIDKTGKLLPAIKVPLPSQRLSAGRFQIPTKSLSSLSSTPTSTSTPTPSPNPSSSPTSFSTSFSAISTPLKETVTIRQTLTPTTSPALGPSKSGDYNKKLALPFGVAFSAIVPLAILIAVFFVRRRRRRDRIVATVEAPPTDPGFFKGLKKRVSIRLGRSAPPAYAEREREMQQVLELDGEVDVRAELPG